MLQTGASGGVLEDRVFGHLSGEKDQSNLHIGARRQLWCCLGSAEELCSPKNLISFFRIFLYNIGGGFNTLLCRARKGCGSYICERAHCAFLYMLT